MTATLVEVKVAMVSLALRMDVLDGSKLHRPLSADAGQKSG
ncbi:MAG TPA: hypothetical protein VM533_10000 [Fimbriiglobus sp.]|jgi:hypothetical protein|nr:hypothetical protein [Fimbriiglobus sp.]